MLGEDLPQIRTHDEKIGHLNETTSKLSCLSDDELLTYKMMSDPSKIMAMKFLWRLQVSLLMGKPSFIPHVTLKMIHMSLVHGMSAMYAIGFVYFGSILASIGNIKDGYRFVKLAKNIVQRFGYKDVAGEVLFMSTHTIGYVEPIQSTLECYLEGYTAALEAGDTTSACLNLLSYCNNLFWSGASLGYTKNKYDELAHFTKKHNLTSLEFVIRNNMVEKLFEMGDVNRTPVSDGLHEDILRIKNPFSAKMFHISNAMIAFMNRDIDNTLTSMEKYFDFDLEMWILLNFIAAIRFFIGLISFWVYRRTNDRKWYERGSQSKEAMRKWAESSKWNCLQKFILLEAEDHFCNKRYERAKESYDDAIMFSRQHKFINDEAIACELAGYFLFEVGETASSIDYIIQAHEKYHKWGAIGKASVMFQYFQSISTVKLPVGIEPPVSREFSSGNRNSSMTTLKARQKAQT